MIAPRHTPILTCVVDLLLAAKGVACLPANTAPEQLASYRERLNEAIIAFEEEMPDRNEVIVQESAIARYPAHRAGAEAALSFLRDHEGRSVNLGDFEPAELHRQLVALGGLQREQSPAFLYVVGLFLSPSVIDHAPYLGTYTRHWPGWSASESCACNALAQF